MTKLKFRKLHILILLVTIVATSLVVDYFRISAVKPFPQKPAEKKKTEKNQIYLELVNGDKNIDWSRLDGTLEFVNGQYDTSDFDLVNLIRIMYEFSDQIPQDVRSKIENALLNYRYWWDEPGGNSLCYWSENHQILFASAEYLAGQLFPKLMAISSMLPA